MADRAQFQKKLGELLAAAAGQGNKITQQEVEDFFQEDQLNEEQMNLVSESGSFRIYWKFQEQ